MKQLQKDIEEIKVALLGNEFNKNGLLQRVDKLEEYQAKDRKFKYLVTGGFAVVMFLINYLK